MKKGPRRSGVDGGRIAARGFRYQYLRTLESMLDFVEDPQVASARIEGPPNHEGHVDAVDFDVLDVDGSCRLAVQVKSKAPESSVSAAEVFAVLVHLVSGHDAWSYQLLTNGVPTFTAQQLAEALSANVDPIRLQDKFAEILATAPARLSQLQALKPQQVERLARCRVIFDARDDVEILGTLRENLRSYRTQASSGLGQRSAGILTGYLVSEIFRRAANGSEAVFTTEELRSHLLVDAKALVRVSGVRDWGVVIGPIPPVPDVGRPALLRRLVEAFDMSRSGGVCRAALVGLSGIGKSSLAADYVADRADFYDWIFWVDSETADSLLTSFRRILESLRPGGAVESYQASAAQVRDDVHSELSRLAGRWAIIFDNVSDRQQTESWIPRSGGGDIIVTTIDSTARHGAATVINVGVMERAEAVELLSKRLSVAEDDRHYYADELCRLANELSCWPLALELASGYMDSCGISLGNVDHYLQRLKVRSLADVDSLPPNYPRTLAAALSLCLDKLHHRIVQEGDGDYRALLALGVVTYSAFLASRQLPIHMLAAAVVIDPGVEPETTPVCLHPSEYNLGEVIRELRRFSLVSYDDDLPPTTGERLADGDRTITTNSIVQDLIRVSARFDNMSEALNRLTNHVARWLSAAIELNHLERASVMFNHANTLAGHLLRLNIHGKYVPYLYGNLAGAYRAMGEVHKAEAFLRAELDALRESTEPNELLVVQAKVALIDILFDTPVLASINLAEATAYLEHVLQYLVEVSAEYQPAAVKLATDVKMLLSRPAATAVNDPRLEAIEHKCNELIAQLGSTCYSQAIDWVNQANMLMQENRPAEAERLCRYALRAGLLTGGMELIARRIFVEALVRQRKWQAAQEGFRNFRKYFGPTEFHLYAIAEMVHNAGLDCARLALIERDQDAASLLGEMLNWPVMSRVLTEAASSARLRLIATIRDLIHGDYHRAEMMIKTIRPADLIGDTSDTTTAWCLLWQIVRLAVFRVSSKNYMC